MLISIATRPEPPSSTDQGCGVERAPQWDASRAANRDPIAIAAEILLKNGTLTDALIVKIHEEAVAAAKAAMQFSDESPIPPADELLKDVYI